MSTAPRPLPALVLALMLSACGGLPGAGDAARRGAGELAVKADHAALLADVEAGGGPALTRAFDAAGVPGRDRAARAIQLRGDLGLYAASPGALALALSAWGGP